MNEILKKLRGSRTISEVSNLSGVSVTTLRNMESGKSKPYDITLLKLATFYGVKISELGFEQEIDHGSQQKQAASYNIRVLDRPARILKDVMGKRFSQIIDDIRAGMDANEIQIKYGLDESTYGVYIKILYGGLSRGDDQFIDRRWRKKPEKVKIEIMR